LASLQLRHGLKDAAHNALYRALSCSRSRADEWLNAYEFTACITAIGPKYDDDDATIRMQVRELEERANLAPGKVFIARNACKMSRFASEIAVGPVTRQKDRPMQSGDNAPS